MFKIEWVQTMWFDFNDEKLKVRLNEKKQRMLTFDDPEFYNQFKELHSEVAPKENPFLGFSSSIVPRATVVQKPSIAKPFDPEKEALELKTYMQFEMFKEKFNFFKGSNWVRHSMCLELDQNNALKGFEANLWQVTIQSHDNFANNKHAEEIFLLNTVEQVITGTDFSMQLASEQDVLDQSQPIGGRPTNLRLSTTKKQTLTGGVPMAAMMGKGGSITASMMQSMAGATENEAVPLGAQV